MKRINARKLDLKRETLAPLQSNDLDAINGGVVHTGCLSQCTQCSISPRPNPSPFPRPGTSNLLQVCQPGGGGGLTGGLTGGGTLQR